MQADYAAAAALDPEDTDAHVGLGAMLASRGDLAGAARSYARALAVNPGHANAHYNLGNVYIRIGKYFGNPCHVRRCVGHLRKNFNV